MWTERTLKNKNFPQAVYGTCVAPLILVIFALNIDCLLDVLKMSQNANCCMDNIVEQIKCVIAHILAKHRSKTNWIRK